MAELSDFSKKIRNEILKNSSKEPIFVNFGMDNVIIYALEMSESNYSPYCKNCWNSLVIRHNETPINKFDDENCGICDKCSIIYPIRYV
jgi:hypothetical protein